MNDIRRNYSGIVIACSLALSVPLASCTGAASMPKTVSGASGTSGTGTSGTSGTSGASGTLPSPTYPTGSLQLALFQNLNQARSQCGFPALQENTILDRAAEAHQKYQVANSTGSDTEVAGKPDFTGATALSRVESFGFPSNAVGGGASSQETILDADANTVAQEALFFDLLADVYSATNMFTPVNLVGMGANSSVEAGQTAFVSVDVFDTATQPIASSPITFPCAGSTNVAVTNSQSLNIPDSGGEIGTVGPEILVMGKLSDSIVLTSGTMASSTGGSFTLMLLDSANDPNKLLQPFQSVAYVTANDLNNIQPSTEYAVSINGTVNGAPFSRNFTITTENDLATGNPFPAPPNPTPTPQPTPAPMNNPGTIK